MALAFDLFTSLSAKQCGADDVDVTESLCILSPSKSSLANVHRSMGVSWSLVWTLVQLQQCFNESRCLSVRSSSVIAVSALNPNAMLSVVGVYCATNSEFRCVVFEWWWCCWYANLIPVSSCGCECCFGSKLPFLLLERRTVKSYVIFLLHLEYDSNLNGSISNHIQLVLKTYLKSNRSEGAAQRVAAVVVSTTKMMIDSFENCQRFAHRLEYSHLILVRRLLVPQYFPILIYYPVN